MLPSPRVELTFVALVSSRMEVIVVFASEMVVAVVSGLLVTKELEVDAEDFTINQNNKVIPVVVCFGGGHNFLEQTNHSFLLHLTSCHLSSFPHINLCLS